MKLFPGGFRHSFRAIVLNPVLEGKVLLFFDKCVYMTMCSRRDETFELSPSLKKDVVLLV